MNKILKTFGIFAILLVFQHSFALAQTPEKENASDLINVKTFDFERILEETAKYFKAANEWKKIKCSAKSDFICTKRECPEIKSNNAHLIIDRKKKSLSICNHDKCKKFKATIKQIGVFNTVKIKKSDRIFIKILGDNRYKEIAMLGLDAYISNGECEPYDEEAEKKLAEEKESKKKKYKLKKGK